MQHVIDDLIVKLSGQDAGYAKLMKDAVAQINETVNSVRASLEWIEEASEDAMRDAQKITASVATATEKYAMEVERLDRHLKEGRISQETYNRAINKAFLSIPEVQQAMQAARKETERLNNEFAKNTAAFAAKIQAELNQELRMAETITKGVRTETEEYSERVGILDNLLKRNRITQETYNRALEELNSNLSENRRRLEVAEKSQQQYTDALRRAEQILLRNMTPMEKYQQELGEINLLHQHGILPAQDYQRELKRLEQQYDFTGQRLKAMSMQFQTFGSYAKSAGLNMSLYVTAPIAAFGAASVKSFADYEQGVAGIRASTNLTAEQIALVERAASNSSRELQTGPMKAVDSFRELIKAGLTLEQVLAGDGEAAMRFSKVAEMDAATSAVILVDMMRVFGESAEKTSNILSAAADASSTDIKGISQSMSQVSAVANLADQSLQDTAAAIALLGSNAIKGSDAGTSLKTMFSQLLAPSEGAAKIIEQYDLQVRAASGSMKPLAGILDELQAKLGGLDEKSKDEALKELFGNDALRAGAILLREGSDGLRAFSQDMDNAKDVSEKYNELMSTTNGQWERFAGAVDRMQIALLKLVDGAIGDFLGSAASVIDTMTAWIEKNETLATVLLTLAGMAALLGPVVMVIGSIAGGISTLITVGGFLAPVLMTVAGAIASVTVAAAPVIATIAAITATIAGLIYLIGGKEGLISVWNSMKEAFGFEGDSSNPAVKSLEEIDKEIARMKETAKPQGKQIGEEISTGIAEGINKASEDITKEVDKLTKRFEIQRETFDMSTRMGQVHALKMEGATDEQLARAKELAAILDKMDEDKKKAEKKAKVKDSKGRYEAALFGSSEAEERIAAYREMMKNQGDDKVIGTGTAVLASGPSAKPDKIEALLENIADNTSPTKNPVKREFEILPAGLK